MQVRPQVRARQKRRTRAGRIAILGRPNVGKSTLLNAILGEPIAIVSPHPQTTRDRIAGIVTRKSTQFVFLDTPGVHVSRTKLGARMNSAVRAALDEADVVVLMTETQPRPRAELGDEDARALAMVPAGKPVVLVLNKVDRVKNKALLLPALEKLAAGARFVAIVPMSARKADATERLLAEVEPLLPEGDMPFPEDELSDRPLRFFVAELVREQILQHVREEVPHGVAVTVDSFDEAAAIPVIEIAIHVDKEAHKGILIGKRGTMLKTIGQEARKKIERLVGRQVHMKLWVRVTPRWYESDAALRELGYGEP
jgi:GTP-binding protein Era